MQGSSDETPSVDPAMPSEHDRDEGPVDESATPTAMRAVDRRGLGRRASERLGALLPNRYRLPVAGLLTAIAVVAVVASTLPSGLMLERHDPATASSSPFGSPGPDASGQAPGPTPTDRPPIVAYTQHAELTASSTAGGVVARDTTFRLASVDDTPATDLASRISVVPPLDLAIEPESDGSVRLRPTGALAAGVVYRFTLAGADGHPADSWAFQAKQAVGIAATVPGDTDTDVPLDTGIEITFDQDGIVDAASHVSIRPATKGRFEQHGRTLAFIPSRLQPATLYTVTVKRGVTVSATGETLAEDFRFRFETAARRADHETTFRFPDDLMEVATTSRADLPIFAFNEDGSDPTTARIEVYRLRDLDGAIDAFRQLRGSASWARWSAEGAVPTTGLRRVMAFDAQLRNGTGSLWIRLPERLAQGWYLVQRPSPKRPTQMILQATDVAGYLTVSSTRTLVWANDLVGGRALADARVTLDGAELGRTDASGLLLAGTPEALRDGSATGDSTQVSEPVVVLTTTDGRSMFMPAIEQRGYGFDTGYGYAGDSRYWLAYHTDRSIYRRTDTINVWGVIRDRSSGVVPETVDVQLVAAESGPQQPPIVTITARPGPTGAFIGSLALHDLPEASYDLVLRTGGAVVSSTAIQVDRILKPAYRLSVETGRNVYIQGDRIKITTRATFYEGSPVPGVPLRIDGAIARSVRTDATGTATYRTTARIDPDEGYGEFETQSISVDPARAEEGDIAGSTREFVVFPSTRTLDADAVIRRGRVRVTGRVHLLDRDRVEAGIAAGGSAYELDPRGQPVGGATVSVTFIEYLTYRVKVGTQYDWIEKKVIPLYETRTYRNELRTLKVRTASDGSFSTSIPDSGKQHDYSVNVSVGDRDGHTTRLRAWAAGGGSTDTDLGDDAYLEDTRPAEPHDASYAVGDAIDLTVRENRPVSTGRYLFAFAQQGLRTAVVQQSRRLQTAFRDWAVPNVVIRAVHFTGTRYIEIQEYYAGFRSADRAIDVGLSTTRPRYAPGDDVTVDVRTRDGSGKPIPATVLVQAVDAKLYDIGAAATAEPLSDLYASLSSGILVSYTSHRSQRLEDGGGDTGGGDGDDGGRRDFRDALLFRLVETGTDGRAQATFHLSDDLTAWRVSAAAVTADLWAGSRSIDVPVGLPFFVDASLAPEYLAGDRPSVQVRTYGPALAAGSPVRITVGSDSLGLAPRTFSAKAFGTVTVPLPALTTGVHTLTISATTGSGASALSDRLVRTFTVVGSRLERTRTAWLDRVDGRPVPGSAGLTTVVVSDASAGRYLPLLLGVAGGEGARLERALGAAMAARLLAERYGATDGIRPAAEFDGDQYQTPDGGIAPVPYASSDLQLTAFVAIAAPERFRSADLRTYLESVLANPRSTRERRVYAVAGLAGLGAPVLPQIQAAASDPQLTIREQLITGLGAAALGDAGSARTILAALWAAHGEEVGATARLRVGDSTSDITDATSLAAILAAASGDARAPALWAYVEANPSADAPYELYAPAFVDRLIDRLPVQPASFAYVIDGQRTVVELDTGDSFQLTLTARQRSSLRIETIAGVIGMTATWREPVAASTIKRDPDIKIVRSLAPAAIRTSDLVRIELTVRFGPKAPSRCHLVTELVPSGLIPMGPMTRWYYDDEENQPSDVMTPVAVGGQRVTFCAGPTKKDRSVRLRYYARVISPGRYVWEPATAESETAAGRAAMTTPTTIRIR